MLWTWLESILNCKFRITDAGERMVKKSQVVIGTSGWSYDHWKGTFYSEQVPKSKWFKEYNSIFFGVELNSTFYNLPSEKSLSSWRDNSPGNFTFAVKASRYITRMKKLKDPSQNGI